MPGLLSLARRALLGFAALASLLAGGRAFAEDTFLLALTWQPGFCADRAAATECRNAPKDEPRLVLHGLWPQWDANGDGKRNAGDDFCVSGAGNRKSMIGLDEAGWLKLPPVELAEARSDDLAVAMPGAAAGLDRHEWWKHGTCSGLAAEDYFAIAVALWHEVQRGSLARLLADQAGATVQRQHLLDAFEADFGRGSARALMLDCSREDGGTALSEIRIRLKRSGIAQGLTAGSLAIPGKAARGDCGAQIRVPGWPR